MARTRLQSELRTHAKGSPFVSGLTPAPCRSVAQAILFTLRYEGPVPQFPRGTPFDAWQSSRPRSFLRRFPCSAGTLRAVCVPVEFRGTGSFAFTLQRAGFSLRHKSHAAHRSNIKPHPNSCSKLSTPTRRTCHLLNRSRPTTPATRINNGSGSLLNCRSANVAAAINIVGTSTNERFPRMNAAPAIAPTAAAVTP